MDFAIREVPRHVNPTPRARGSAGNKRRDKARKSRKPRRLDDGLRIEVPLVGKTDAGELVWEAERVTPTASLEGRRSREASDLQRSSDGLVIARNGPEPRDDRGVAEPGEGDLEPPSQWEAEFLSEIDEICADTITAEKLWRIVGTRQLDALTHLDIVIDTSRQSVDDLGRLLPRLQTLNLDGSKVASIRDLGTALQHLQSLSLNDAQVMELDGMSALPSLRELRLRGCNVSNLTPLCTHESLQVLDLARNPIADLDSLEILGTCSLLYALDLQGTPLESATGLSFRPLVLHHIFQLRVLDGRNITDAERQSCTPLSDEALSSAVVALELAEEQAKQEELYLCDEEEDYGGVASPGGGAVKSPSGARDSQAAGGRTSHGRFGSTVMANDVAGQSQEELLALFDATSNLTMGGNSTFAGNPTSIMRERRRKRNTKAKGTSASVDGLQSAQAQEGAAGTTEVSILDALDAMAAPQGHEVPRDLGVPIVEGPMPEWDPSGSPVHLTQSGRGGEPRPHGFFEDGEPKERERRGNQSPSPKTDRLPAGSAEDTDTWSLHDIAAQGPRVGSAPAASASFEPADSHILDFSSLTDLEAPPDGRPGTVGACIRRGSDGRIGRGGGASRSPRVELQRPRTAGPKSPRTVPVFLRPAFASPTPPAAPKPIAFGSPVSSPPAARVVIDLGAQQRSRRKHARGQEWLSNSEDSAAPPFAFSLPSTGAGMGPFPGRRSRSPADQDQDDEDEDSDDGVPLTREGLKARSARAAAEAPVAPRKPPRDQHAAADDGGDQIRARQGKRGAAGKPFIGGQGLSQQAGIRLGFDLHGSLAAISQWSKVDEEEDEEEGVRDCPPQSSPEDLIGSEVLRTPGGREEAQGTGTRESFTKSFLAKEKLLSGWSAIALVEGEDGQRPAPAKVVTRDDILAQCVAAGDREDGETQALSPVHSQPAEEPPSGPEQILAKSTKGGEALLLDDTFLVDMLRKPPKHVPQLRTRDGFRQFFAGMSVSRMEFLLCQAYADREPEEAEKRVKKRMALVLDVLVSVI